MMGNETTKRPTLKKADGSQQQDDTQQNDVKDTNSDASKGSEDSVSAKSPESTEKTPPDVSAEVAAPPVAKDAPDAAKAPESTAPAVTAPAPTFTPPPAPASTPLPTHIDQGVSFDVFVAKMKEKGEQFVEKVDVVADHAYRLTLDNGFVVQMIKGVQSVHRFIAEHPYSLANGLKPYDRSAGTTPTVPENALQYAKEEIAAGRMTVDYAIKNLSGFYKVTEEKAKEVLQAFIAPK